MSVILTTARLCKLRRLFQRGEFKSLHSAFLGAEIIGLWQYPILTLPSFRTPRGKITSTHWWWRRRQTSAAYEDRGLCSRKRAGATWLLPLLSQAVYHLGEGHVTPGCHPWEITDTVYCFYLLPQRKKKLLHGDVTESLAPTVSYKPANIHAFIHSLIQFILGTSYVPGAMPGINREETQYKPSLGL